MSSCCVTPGRGVEVVRGVGGAAVHQQAPVAAARRLPPAARRLPPAARRPGVRAIVELLMLLKH